MRKVIMLAIMAVLGSMSVSAQSIERTSKFEGGKVEITSGKKIFSGCQLHMCNYTKNGKRIYGIELDLRDRANHVSEGNHLTIHFEDGSKITVENLFDTRADVSQESHVRTYDSSYTDFVPVYDAWEDAIYSVPVTRHQTQHVPETSTTTFIKLYYVVTPVQIKKIITSKIKEITIVTDEDTITKKARTFSEAVSELYELVK